MAEAVRTAMRADQMEMTRSDEYRVVYTNQSALRLTHSDMQLTFSLIKNLPGASGMVLEEQVAIVMSPQTAKLTALALQKAVAAFEAQFGEIYVPPGVALNQETYNQLARSISESLKSKP